MMLVGIGFNYQVGKDTAATALGRELGFQRVAFADPLRELAMLIDPLITGGTSRVNIGIGHGRYAHTVKGLGYEEAKRVYPEVRQFLQRLGDAGRTVFGEDFWLNQALGRAITFDRVVLPDVRYRNEAEAIKNAGGFLIKITRPGHRGDAHKSETELVDYDGWDLVIDNNGSVSELEIAVVEAVRNELKNRGEL